MDRKYEVGFLPVTFVEFPQLPLMFPVIRLAERLREVITNPAVTIKQQLDGDLAEDGGETFDSMAEYFADNNPGPT